MSYQWYQRSFYIFPMYPITKLSLLYPMDIPPIQLMMNIGSV